MHTLPVEILLHILSYLEPADIVRLQSVSSDLFRLTRDAGLWRDICFDRSPTAEQRRRQLLMGATIAYRLPEFGEGPRIVRFPNPLAGSDAASQNRQSQLPTSRSRSTALANWDPSYPGENVNFYEEYIHRHAPVTMNWFEGSHRADISLQAVGAGVLYDNSGAGMAERLVAPLDDGSIGIWDSSLADAAGGKAGRLVGRSRGGLLSGTPDGASDGQAARSRSIMTETGTVECVSIDSRQKRAYYAVQNNLNEVDLETLRIISRTQFPCSITALSEAKHPAPLTVGTNWSLHLHDTRQRTHYDSSRCELIGGAPLTISGVGAGHARLSQPGPLSILHLPTPGGWSDNGEIWVAGRFTSLLNYDRRMFPSLRGSVHSGARLSCLASAPRPFVGRNEILSSTSPAALREARSIAGQTIIAAGEYKGKGSLEFYGLSSDPTRSILATDVRTLSRPQAFFHNRQTASSSKLLSVAPHGARYVFSDGDGNLKWIERDGFSVVRQVNINQEGFQPADHTGGSASAEGDIVQKIIPTVDGNLVGGDGSAPLGKSNLIIWTADGRLGMVGYGNCPTFTIGDPEGPALSAEEEERLRKEREYEEEMRTALERQAAELTWVRGFGLSV